jgi:Uncharacterized phage-associated protein
MANAHDIANYILKKLGRMTAMKMQKLVYYAQAWSLVWDEKPLFRNRIEAWINGPVVPNLYSVHRGKFDLKEWPKGDPGNLTVVQRETVDAVLGFYGDKTSQWLSDLTHSELPWKDARRGLAPTDRCGNEITHASMAEYYSSVASIQQA